jgi:phosphopantothenoylcysteine decarboxylase
MESDSLLLIATGAGQTMLLTEYLIELQAWVGRKTTVMLTASAERFVTPESVGWFADRVITHDAPGVNPVELAMTAGAIVVLPATANTISSAALGLAATPAQTALLASPAPVLYFPQIKRHMWDKPVIQRHVAELRAEGNTVIDPVETTTYQMWKREEAIGFAMPGAEEAAKIVRDWLADRPATP